jgi:hypothetical protein
MLMLRVVAALVQTTFLWLFPHQLGVHLESNLVLTFGKQLCSVIATFLASIHRLALLQNLLFLIHPLVLTIAAYKN